MATPMPALRIQELLDDAERNLYWLSKETGIPYTTLLRYRDGEKVSIRLDHAEAICNALKRDANALMGIGKPGKLKK